MFNRFTDLDFTNYPNVAELAKGKELTAYLQKNNLQKHKTKVIAIELNLKQLRGAQRTDGNDPDFYHLAITKLSF